MRRFGFCTMVAALGFCSGAAQAQTLFEVEHARGNYRAGLVSEYDADLVRTWGAPSGNYPGARYLDARQRETRAVRTPRARAKRTTGNSTGN